MRTMLEKPRTILATPALVKEFVEMEPAPHDRPLSERRIQVYRRILKDGNFRPVTWASVLCKETNCTYRVNGKHTSVMLGTTDKLPEFYVVLERWQCDTLNDVASLYGTFDSAIASRSTADINMSFASTIPELRGIGSRFINMAVTAAANIQWSDTEGRKVPAAEKAELLIERADAVVWLRDLCGSEKSMAWSQNCRHMMRTAVVQAMILTNDKASTRKAALDFWTMVRDESAPDRDDPTRVLARFLVKSRLTKRLAGHEAKAVSQREIFVKCLHAWNAWRAGEPTALKYHAAAAIPKVEK